MQTPIKRYSIILRGRVQHIGYRGINRRHGQKFDIGLDYLDGIKTDTGEVKATLGDMNGTLNSIDNTLGSFVVESREHNQWMKEHNQHLENILVKLAEK